VRVVDGILLRDRQSFVWTEDDGPVKMAH